MSLKISLAQWYDFDAVSKLRREHWLHDMRENPDLTPTDIGIATFDQAMQVGGWLRNPKAAVILASDGPEPLGYAVFNVDLTCPYRQEPTAFVDGFYVKPEARRRHVGGLLYRYGYRIFSDANRPRYIQAVVLHHNANVQRMLVGFGFRESGKLFEKDIRHAS